MEQQSLQLGAVFSRIGTTLRQNARLLAILSLTLGYLPAVVWGWAIDDLLTGSLILAPLTGIASFVLLSIFLAAVIYVTVKSADGGEARIQEALSLGGRVFLPLVAHNILLSIGIYAGLLLLLVPGLILTCMWAVSIPALIAERAGIIGSFGRSRQLTKGSRWRIFALLCVAFVIATLVLGASLALGLTATVEGFGLATILWNGATTTLFYLIWGVGSASLFVELRRAKEGTSAEQIRHVFA